MLGERTMADTIIWSKSKQVNTNLVVKLNGGSTEGSNMFTYNGSAAKTINIKPGTAISISGTTIRHANVVTAGNAGPGANYTVNAGGSFTVPYVTYNAQGHITGSSNRTITLNSALGNFEPVQKRATYKLGDTGYIYKRGYAAFFHVANEAASSVIKTVPSACKPKAAVCVSGFCKNNTNGGKFYPCTGEISNDGTWSVLFTTSTYGANEVYYLYSKGQGINNLSKFNVWLSGAWATDTNG